MTMPRETLNAYVCIGVLAVLGVAVLLLMAWPGR